MSHFLFAAHDPGGANMLRPVIALALAEGDRVSLVADGPAREIWRDADDDVAGRARKVDPANAFEPLRPDLLITGTSFCGFERSLWSGAHKRGIGSVAAIDAWTNLRRRFEGQRAPEMPKAICVADEAMRDEIAGGKWCHARLHVTGHPHLQAVVARLRRERAHRAPVADLPVTAFFSEPVDEDHGGIEAVGYDQFSIAGAVVGALDGEGAKILLVKPHPREDMAVWRDWLDGLPLPEGMTILVDDGAAEDILARCDTALGIHSMALVEAALSGIPALAVQIGRNRRINPVLETVFQVPVATDAEGLAGALRGAVPAPAGAAGNGGVPGGLIDHADARMLAAIRAELPMGS